MVDSATLLTPEVDKAGWLHGPAVLRHFDEMPLRKTDGLDKCNLESKTVVEAVQEAFGKYSVGKRYFEKVSAHLVRECASSMTRLGYHDYEVFCTLERIPQIMSHNVAKIWKISEKMADSKTKTMEIYPDARQLCLEEAYGYIFAKHPKMMSNPTIAWIVCTIPLFIPRCLIRKEDLFSTDPSELVARRISKRVKSCSLSTVVELPPGDNFQDEESYMKALTCLQKVKVHHKHRLPRKRRTKLNHLIRDMWRLQKKNHKRIIRHKIMQGLSLEDYRLAEVDDISPEVLKAALNNVKTAISVKNNATFRSYKHHLFASFFDQVKMDDDEAQVARLIREQEVKFQQWRVLAEELMMPYGYFVSDWQNKFAKQWNTARSRLIILAKALEAKTKPRDGVELTLVTSSAPPPVPYVLAADLYPASQPFYYLGSYGSTCYHTALIWICQDAKDDEVVSFLRCVVEPPKNRFVVEAVLDHSTGLVDGKQFKTIPSLQLIEKLSDEFKNASMKVLFSVCSHPKCKFDTRERTDWFQLLDQELKELYKRVSDAPMRLNGSCLSPYTAASMFHETIQVLWRL